MARVLLPIFTLLLLAAGATAQERVPAPNTLTPQERAAGWKLLFDGRSLQGWHGFRQKSAPPEWQAVDGALVLNRRSAPGVSGELGVGLTTDEQWDDFELTLEWKLAEGGNSGVFYRVSEEESAPNMSGPEMQVLDNLRHPDAQHGLNRTAGACYQVYPPTRDVTAPVGQWNRARLVAQGSHIEHWLNGERVVVYELGSADWQARVRQSKYKDRPRYGRVPKGHLVLQDHEHRVEYRNLKIRPLKPGSPASRSETG